MSTKQFWWTVYAAFIGCCLQDTLKTFGKWTAMYLSYKGWI